MDHEPCIVLCGYDIYEVLGVVNNTINRLLL